MALRALPTTSISRRALSVEQLPDHPLFLLCLTGDELMQIADISRIAREDGERLIGYQRPEVRRHVNDIVKYLDGDQVLFPNSIIIALSSACRFTKSRGPNVSDGFAASGTLDIPLPASGGPKPGWIVDGQQRAIALTQAKRRDFPVPVNAFIADEVELQRDQFIRVNNTKPLPRGLVSELLPEVSLEISPRLSAARIPSELTTLLNTKDDSPFRGMIRRASTPKPERKNAVITDTSVAAMLQDSLTSASGALFPYRNIATGETDFESIWRILIAYWRAVRRTFPTAWGLPARESRLMHGVGIRAMGRLMDRIVPTIEADGEDAIERVCDELSLIAPYCRWTAGRWDGLNAEWNDLENTPKDIKVLANYLIRLYLQMKKS